MKQLPFFFILFMITQVMAMEIEPEPTGIEQKETQLKPNIPKYDRARGVFTKDPLSLTTQASKQVARNYVSHFKNLNGKTIDEFATKIEKEFSRLPTELHPLVTQHVFLSCHENHENGYHIVYRKYPSDNYHHSVNSDHTELYIKKNNDELQKTLPYSPMGDMSHSPNEEFLAIGLNDGTIKIFQNNNNQWNLIKETRNASFNQTRIPTNRISIHDDGTCMGYIIGTDTIILLNKDFVENIKSAFMIHEAVLINKNQLFISCGDSQKPESHLYSCEKQDTWFFNQLAQSKTSTKFLPSTDGKSCAVLENKWKNVQIFHRTNTATWTPVITMKHNKRNSLYHFENGILDIRRIKNTNAHFIDFETGKRTFRIKRYGYGVSPNFNPSLNAMLASIAYSNSKNSPKQLFALESSHVIKNLAEEYKYQIDLKIKKAQLKLASLSLSNDHKQAHQ